MIIPLLFSNFFSRPLPPSRDPLLMADSCKHAALCAAVFPRAKGLFEYRLDKRAAGTFVAAPPLASPLTCARQEPFTPPGVTTLSSSLSLISPACTMPNLKAIMREAKRSLFAQVGELTITSTFTDLFLPRSNIFVDTSGTRILTPLNIEIIHARFVPRAGPLVPRESLDIRVCCCF